MRSYDIALILAAAFALATFSVRDIGLGPVPDRDATASRTAMTTLGLH